MVYHPSFIPGDPRGFCQNLLRGLTCESVLNLCFLSGITVKPCVSPHVVSVAYPSFPEVHSLSRTGGSPRIQYISLYIYIYIINSSILARIREAEELVELQELQTHCRRLSIAKRLHSIKESSSVGISEINGSFAYDSNSETETY